MLSFGWEVPISDKYIEKFSRHGFISEEEALVVQILTPKETVAQLCIII